MQNVWLASSVWLALALAASIISIRVAISVALIEIVVGALAGAQRWFMSALQPIDVKAAKIKEETHV